MAEYKGKLLSGLFTKANNVLLDDGTAIPILKSAELSGTTSANGNIPISKSTYPNAIGAVMLTPDNSSLRVTGGTSTNWYLFAYNDYNNQRLNSTAITFKLYYLE